MNQPNDPKVEDDAGAESDFSEYSRTRVPPPAEPSKTGSVMRGFLRGCGIALGIAFLLLAFVVGACFMSV